LSNQDQDEILTRTPASGTEETLTKTCGEGGAASAVTLTKGAAAETATVEPESVAKAPPKAGHWVKGNLIDDRYEVLGELGHGGMGIVYKILHREWHIEMALKVARADKSVRDKELFLKEAEAWVDLGLHPNIVQCWYVREIEEVACVFADYVAGGTLRDWIRRGQVKPGDWETIIDLAIQACDGLGYAHAKGLVHRDVKPANFLITEKGRLCVSDFGLAKAMGGAWLTPAYSSPEQCSGAGTLDQRTDLFSLGVVLFELCCGQRPDQVGSPEEREATGTESPRVVLGRVLTKPIPDPREVNPHVPEVLARIILGCLEKEPERRPASAAELRESLAQAYQTVEGEAYPRPVPKAAGLRADSLNNRAASFWDLGKKMEAFAEWGEALKLDGKHIESTYNEALARWREGEIDDDDAIKRVSLVAGESAQGRLCLAMLESERGALDEADRQLAEAARLAQGQAVAPASTRSASERAVTPAELALVKQFVRRHREGGHSLELRRSGHKLRAHQDEPRGLAIAGDGRQAVTVTEDRHLRLWDLATGVCLKKLNRGAEDIHHVALTPDGRHAVSMVEEGLELWDLLTGSRRCLPEKHGSSWMHPPFALSADGRYVLSASSDRNLRVWEISTGVCLYRLENPGFGEILALAVDGRHALVGEHAYIRHLDLATGKCLQELTSSPGKVEALAIAPDGGRAVSLHHPHLLRFWDLGSGRCMGSHKAIATCVAITADGKHAVSAGNALQVWDLASGRCIRSIHLGDRYPTTIAAGARYCAFPGADHSIERWQVDVPAKHDVAIMHLCKVPSHTVAEDREKTHRARIARAEAALQEARFDEANTLLCQARTVRGYERDSHALLVQARLARVLPRVALLRAWPLRTSGETNSDLHGSLALTPDWQRAVSLSTRAISIWDVPAGKVVRRFEETHFMLNTVAIAASGRFIAVGGEKVWIREVQRGMVALALKVKGLGVARVTISPDDKYVVAGTRYGAVCMWELASQGEGHTAETGKSAINTLAVDPSSRLVISGSEDGTARLWELASGKCVRNLLGHQAAVTASVFTGDGLRAVSAAADGIRIWELSTGKCVQTFPGSESGYRVVAITNDVRYLVAGSAARLLAWNLLTGQSIPTPPEEVGFVAAIAGDASRVIVGRGQGPEVWQLDWQLGAAPARLPRGRFGQEFGNASAAKVALKESTAEHLDLLVNPPPRTATEEPIGTSGDDSRGGPPATAGGSAVPPIPSGNISPATDEAHREEARQEIADLMCRHLDRLSEGSRHSKGFAIMSKKWELLRKDEVLAFASEAALRMACETLRDGGERTQTRAFGTIWVAVSVFLTTEENVATATYPGGYLQTFYPLVTESGWMKLEIDVAHWIYSFTRRGPQKIDLAFLPARSLTEEHKILSFPRDLMTREERIDVGIRP
jgi:serine/threonine protein kinase/WD40 repeat protein